MHNQALQKLKQDSQAESTPFTPEIDPLSRVLADARRKRHQPTYERLIECGMNSQAKKELIRQMNGEIEKISHTFTPKIDSV